jgi:hydrogenase nickel incorporation protein HypB
MCKECGCGLGDEVRILSGSESEAHGSAPGHGEPEPAKAAEPKASGLLGAGQTQGLSHAHEGGGHTVTLHRSLLEKNQRLAERNRGFFRAKGLLVLNVVSAPGSGKTTLIERTAAGLRGRLRCGVIVGDLATDRDATRLRAVGIPVVQVATGTVCHLDAEMVQRAARQLPLDGLDLLILENVGNLVCPADFDLGEDLRVVLLSVTEGEDKPLKYPPLFHSAHVAVVTKTDLAEAAGFDRAAALENLHRISHHARVFEVSAKTGAGMDAWLDHLVAEHQRVNAECW